MSFKDTQSYKELQADWRWIHSMDPEAAAIADQWVKEHPEEWKELEHMLYYSEANFHKRVAPDTLEDVDIKQPLSGIFGKPIKRIVRVRPRPLLPMN